MNPFEKEIRPGSAPKDGMNIAIISDFNIAGQPTHLMRAINKYSPHRARCIIGHGDYMEYDRDVLLTRERGALIDQKAVEEAMEIVKAADFFHFGRAILEWPGVEWNGVLTQRNCVIKYYGSELRMNGPVIRKWHEQTGVKAITSTDWTMCSQLSGFFHLGSYFTRFGDMAPDEIPWAKQNVEEVVVTCGSGTSGIKRYDVLMNALKVIQAEGIMVKPLVIQGKPNAEAVAEKSKGQICFTSLHQGWGISGIESMWMGQPVLCALDPFILSLFPKQPAVIVDEKTLKARLKTLVLSPGLRDHIAMAGRDFVETHFRTTDILRRYLYIIDLIMKADLYAGGNCAVPRLYQFPEVWDGRQDLPNR
jgi:hypothetical protein